MIKDWDIYRYFKEDTLLYVGISYDALARQKQHMSNRNNKWKSIYDRMEREIFTGTRSELEQREKTIIQSENPVYNVTHVLSTEIKPKKITEKKPDVDYNLKIIDQELIPYYEQFMMVLEEDVNNVILYCSKSIGEKLIDYLSGFYCESAEASTNFITSMKFDKNICVFNTDKDIRKICIEARDNDDLWLEKNKDGWVFLNWLTEQDKFFPMWKKSA